MINMVSSTVQHPLPRRPSPYTVLSSHIKVSLRLLDVPARLIITNLTFIMYYFGLLTLTFCAHRTSDFCEARCDKRRSPSRLFTNDESGQEWKGSVLGPGHRLLLAKVSV